MEGMFRQVGIYSSVGQLYTPQDADQLMFYREDKKGQILEEGINEAGSLCSWLAAATAYSNHGVSMIPFYIYYSMFGYQRVGDLVWAFSDSRGRGFMLGGTAGRTTLNGEGLQHQDGHSPLLFSVPVSYTHLDVYKRQALARLEYGQLISGVTPGQDDPNIFAATSFRDPLTNLPSRMLFHDRVEQALHRRARHVHPVAVMVIDLAGSITAVKEEMGGDAADRLMVQAVSYTHLTRSRAARTGRAGSPGRRRTGGR